MKILTKEQFINKKKSDTLAIFGTGYSINQITSAQWNIIDNEYDSIGFGWYCQSKRPTTWYVIREQANKPLRQFKNHELNDLFRLMEFYKDSTKIIKDMPYRIESYPFAQNHDKFNGDGFIFNELHGKCNAKSFRDDIFEAGIHHGSGTLWDVLHFAVGMGYETVVFFGIDLYDNRYFYLNYNETFEMVANEGRTCESKHLLHDKILKIVSSTISVWKLNAFVHNEKSPLSQIIKVW